MWEAAWFSSLCMLYYPWLAIEESVRLKVGDNALLDLEGSMAIRHIKHTMIVLTIFRLSKTYCFAYEILPSGNMLSGTGTYQIMT
jgi:hypothetical protein